MQRTGATANLGAVGRCVGPPPKRRIPMRKLAALVCLALFVACSTGESGGDITVPEEPTPSASTEASAPAAGEVNEHGTKTFTTDAFDVEVELDNFYFNPTYIKSPGGAKATVELHNEGTTTHTFTVPGLDIDEELEPDAKKSIEVEIGTETRYEFYCRFHKDQGMRGAFMPH
jgi:plastocyanin